MADPAFARSHRISSKFSSCHTFLTSLHFSSKCPPSSSRRPHIQHLVSNFIPRFWRTLLTARVLWLSLHKKCFTFGGQSVFQSFFFQKSPVPRRLRTCFGDLLPFLPRGDMVIILFLSSISLNRLQRSNLLTVSRILVFQFGFSRYIAFDMYLDLAYIYVHKKGYVLKNDKITYNLKRRE